MKKKKLSNELDAFVSIRLTYDDFFEVLEQVEAMDLGLDKV